MTDATWYLKCPQCTGVLHGTRKVLPPECPKCMYRGIGWHPSNVAYLETVAGERHVAVALIVAEHPGAKCVYGTATAGDAGTATAGEGGAICAIWHDATRSIYRRKVAGCGEGVEAWHAYRVSATGEWVDLGDVRDMAKGVETLRVFA